MDVKIGSRQRAWNSSYLHLSKTIADDCKCRVKGKLPGFVRVSGEFELVGSCYSRDYFIFSGGKGSRGGKGRKCRVNYVRVPPRLYCDDDGVGHPAKDGAKGEHGEWGTSKYKLVKIP